MVARRQPGLPDPVVRFVPAATDRLHHRLDDAPVLVLDRSARSRDGGHEIGDRPEHVELDLAVGCVPDPHRPRPGVAGQRLDHGLRPELESLDRVERVQPLRMAARAGDATVDPVQERLGLIECAEVDEHPRRHCGITQPAVPVVPVAHAAELLGERHRRRREDRAGWPVAEAAQGQRASDDVFPGDVGELEPADPVERRLLGPRLTILDRVGVGLDVVGVEAQLEGNVPTGGREVDHRARRVMAAVLEDVPLDTGGEECDRLVVAEYEQSVAERLQLDRHLAELGPRSELEPCDTAPRENADERRTGRRALVVGRPGVTVRNRPLEPVGHRHPRPARLDGHRARPVALAEREPLALGRDREVSGPRAAEDVREDSGRVWPGMAQPGDPGVRGE